MNPKYLLALAGVAALLVAGCGNDDNSTDSATATAGNPIDRAFIADMGRVPGAGESRAGVALL